MTAEAIQALARGCGFVVGGRILRLLSDPYPQTEAASDLVEISSHAAELSKT
jgi:hypothetical protein